MRLRAVPNVSLPYIRKPRNALPGARLSLYVQSIPALLCAYTVTGEIHDVHSWAHGKTSSERGALYVFVFDLCMVLNIHLVRRGVVRVRPFADHNGCDLLALASMFLFLISHCF